MPEIDGATIAGSCSLWCVPHSQPEDKGGLGQRNRRGYAHGVRAASCNAAPRSPSTCSDDLDMFENTRLDIALVQLMSDRAQCSSYPSSPRDPPGSALAETSDNIATLLPMGAAAELNIPFSPSWRPVTPLPSNCLSIGSANSCDSADTAEAAAALLWRQRLLGSSTEPDGAAPTLRMAQPHHDGSADGVIVSLLGVSARRRHAQGSEEPTVREPRAVGLCRMPDSQQLTSLVRKDGSISPSAVFGTVVGDQRRPTSLDGLKAVDNLEAMLRQMPMPNLASVQNEQLVFHRTKE